MSVGVVVPTHRPRAGDRRRRERRGPHVHGRAARESVHATSKRGCRGRAIPRGGGQRCWRAVAVDIAARGRLENGVGLACPMPPRWCNVISPLPAPVPRIVMVPPPRPTELWRRHLVASRIVMGVCAAPGAIVCAVANVVHRVIDSCVLHLHDDHQIARRDGVDGRRSAMRRPGSRSPPARARRARIIGVDECGRACRRAVVARLAQTPCANTARGEQTRSARTTINVHVTRRTKCRGAALLQGLTPPAFAGVRLLPSCFVASLAAGLSLTTFVPARRPTRPSAEVPTRSRGWRVWWRW